MHHIAIKNRFSGEIIGSPTHILFNLRAIIPSIYSNVIDFLYNKIKTQDTLDILHNKIKTQDK